MRATIERSVAADNFSMLALHEVAWARIEADPHVAPIVPELRQRLSTHYRKLAYAVLRSAFLIELVKVPKIETTKFRVRWFEQLVDDPRGCPFNECLDIARDLLTSLQEWLTNPEHAETLRLSFDCGLIPYEAPIDYTRRQGPGGRLHTRGNLTWHYDALVLRTLKLRKHLTDPETSPDATFFRTVLADKIKVKTYLTDRVLTGDYKTNREKRWETHPQSVHFAERCTCMAIEYALVTQLCAFQGFPPAFLQQLQEENILPANLQVALCPITGDTLSYEAFRNELLNPTHGKADFQVGHLNPLKLGAADGQAAGHTAENISWISADGNRIQGSLSLNDVRALIQRVADNYTAHAWWPRHTPR